MSKLKLSILIPDTHYPYHDKKAWRLFKKICKRLKPKIYEFVFLGDFSDFFAVNSHGTRPDVKQMLVEEVLGIREEFDWFDKEFPTAKKVFIEGNHEFRLERYLLNKAPALFGVTSTEHVLGIAGRVNWTFVSYGPSQKYRVGGNNGTLYARHEPMGSNPLATLKRAMHSLVYGHIHRKERASSVTMDGTQLTAFSPGWLGDKAQDKIFGYVKNHHDWQLGFDLVWTDEKGQFSVEQISIQEDYSAVVCGERISL